MPLTVITRHLHLLRHAKSSWDRPVADHERPLNSRGRRSADAMADHLRSRGITPQLVLCSTSERTRETLDLLRPGLPHDIEVRFERELYGASARELLDQVHDVPDAVTSALVVAHNPGIGVLADALAGTGDPDALERLRAGHYPTAALASLRADGPWTTFAEGTAELLGYVVPRELGVS